MRAAGGWPHDAYDAQRAGFDRHCCRRGSAICRRANRRVVRFKGVAVSWTHATQLTLALLILVGAAICFRPRKRNRHLTLPPPSPQCKRPSVESVP